MINKINMNKFDNLYKKVINENVESSPKLAVGNTITWYGDEEYGFIIPRDIKVLKISPNGKIITAGDKRGSFQFDVDKDKHKFTKRSEPSKDGESRATIVDKIKNDQWLENGGKGQRTWTKKFRNIDQAIKWIETNKEEKDWENWEIEFENDEEEGDGVLVYYPGSGWQVDFT